MMATLLDWLYLHWLAVIIIAGLAGASTYVLVKRKSLFYRE
ncbi:hypothetical protein [Paenibacillus beijingensis]|nr:hypothetical protein [Paenibacillus beijingensis]